MTTPTPAGYGYGDAKAHARAAKAYAKAQRPWYKKKRFIFPGILLVLIAIGIAAGRGGGGGDAVTTATSSVPPASGGVSASAKSQPPLKVSSNAFAKEFDANKVAATRKYKDKRVQLTAEVTNIDNSSVSFAKVEDGFSMTQIKCNLRDSEQAVTVANGKSVTIQGTVDGQDFGVIGLNDCVIIK